MSVIEFPEAYTATANLDAALDALRWGLDYLLASRVDDVETIAQVGEPGQDHSRWDPAEQSGVGGPRPAYSVSPSAPGSDVQASMAAALAAGALAFRSVDPAFARRLEANARDLYALADAFRGTYNHIAAAASIYYSSSFQDDLAWAAAWLFRLTNETHFLTEARAHFAGLGGLGTDFSWDSRGPGAALLIGLLLPQPDAQVYLAQVSSFLTSWSTGTNGVTLTPKGLSHSSDWGSLRYSLSACSVGAVYAAHVPTDPKTPSYAAWVASQVDYALGSTGRSFMVGFGVNPPTHCHNRGSSCNGPTGPCGYDDFNLPSPNPNLLAGALVGGPDRTDAYQDVRSNYMANEPALDYSGAFLTPLAYMIQRSMG